MKSGARGFDAQVSVWFNAAHTLRAKLKSGLSDVSILTSEFSRAGGSTPIGLKIAHSIICVCKIRT
jgi:hypothetical protein